MCQVWVEPHDVGGAQGEACPHIPVIYYFQTLDAKQIRCLSDVSNGEETVERYWTDVL